MVQLLIMINAAFKVFNIYNLRRFRGAEHWLRMMRNFPSIR